MTTTPPRLSVIIPAYNEEKNLGKSVGDLTRALRGAGIAYEIVVVNDNSVDATGAVIAALSEGDPNIRAVTRRPPRGFGRAIRAGIEAAEGDVTVIYMADASDSPGDVIRYFREIENGYDCVFGSRFIKGSSVRNYPLVKLWANRVVNTMLRLLFWTRFNDLTNSFKAYRTSVLRECGPFRASHFNITIELSLSALIRNFTITQIPISWEGRTWGRSNLHLSEMGRRYLSTLIKIYCEKMLILDDVLAETVSSKQRHTSGMSQIADRLDRLERRLAALESPESASGRPCAPEGNHL